MITRKKALKRSWLRKKAKKARVLKSGRVILDAAGWAEMRQKLFDRSEGQCEAQTTWTSVGVDLQLKLRCSRRISLETMHAHHKIFRSHGGSDAEGNLVALCQKCHDSFHPGTQWSKGSKRA